VQGATSLIYELGLSTWATPVFGLAVLQPIPGPTSVGVVALAALAIIVQKTLVCCSFPLGPSVVLLAAKYRAVQAEAASMLLILTLALAITVPAMLWLSS
jgi:malonate transporter and related proteins